MDAENTSVLENVANIPEVLPLHDMASKSLSAQININGLTDNVTMNPVVAAAAALIAGLVQLKLNPVCEDMHLLQQSLIKNIITFETKAKHLKISDEDADDARYILCACYDEMILNYVTDKSGDLMGHNSLISVFYHETSGGENAYVLLTKLLQDPVENLDLLELFSICLSIGFEGKYRIMERGTDQLGILRDHLWRTIQQQRGDVTTTLFSEIAAKDTVPVKRWHIPFRAVIGAAVITLFVIGFGFNYALTQAVKPVVQQLQQM